MPAPSADDLRRQMDELAPPPSSAPPAATPTGGDVPTVTVTANAPSAGDLRKQMDDIAPPPGASVTPQPGAIDPLTGKPYQFASAGTPGPVGESTGKPIAEDRVPGPVVQAAGSLATDPEQRRRIIAAQLFPKLGTTDALSRVFYGSDGRLAAVGTDGQPFYVDPAPTGAPSALNPYGPASIASGITRAATDNPLARAGTVAGSALPATGAVVGGALAGPTSVVVGPVAAGAGAALGDYFRQKWASYLDPQAEKTPYNVGQTVTEGVGGALGQLTGAGLLRANPLGATGTDLARLRSGNALTDAEAAYQRAQGQGVQLTPGQASGLPSLLSHEDVIASGSARPGTADIAAEYYRQQRQQLVDAYDRTLGAVSPAADKTDAAMQFQQGAEDAQRIVRQQANTAARPAYQAAQRGGNVPSPDLAQLSEVPAVRTAMDAARRDYANLYRHAAPDSPDFALWDLTKRKLDDAVTVARRAGENTTATALDSLRSDLLTHLDAQYPTYATARETAAPGQRLAARLDDTTGSAIGAGTERARAIVQPVFETNNQRAIMEARDAFHNAGRGDEWNAGVRAYLQDAFDNASKSQDGLNPSTLLRQIWRNPDVRANLQAAMDPAHFHGLENFMGTLEDVARSRGMNSLTQPRAAGAAAMADVAASTPGVRAVRAAGYVLDPRRVIGVLGAAPDAIASWMTGRNIDRIGQRLFSEDGMQYLRAMATLPRGSQRGVMATAQFLAGRVAPALSGERVGNYLAPPVRPTTNALAAGG